RIDLGSGRQAFRQHAGPETWLAAVERDGHGTAERASLAPETQAHEMLMMGLRLGEGVSQKALAQRTCCALDRVISSEGLARLRSAGYLDESGDLLRVTAEGRPLLNGVLAELLV
ncbi:MAG: coproporphyrinogen III oxidase, partial [Sphingomonadales bacterium]|nr:coproporphyrinogen III oxidase [Sphingomonadales bacterium]